MNAIKLDHINVLKVSGDDAISFLQGQLTNDVTELDNSWHFSGYCTPKGRLLALFAAWRHAENIYLLVSRDLCESVSKRLRMYVLRSKVNIEKLEGVTIFGATTVDAIDEVKSSLSERLRGDENEVVVDNGVTVLRVNQRFLVISTATSDETKALTSSDANGTDLWLAYDISEGLPSVAAESSELFLPQMLNLDLLNGISFKKGCYTGQEIVARTHYLGKVKQRMHLCELISVSETSLDNTAGTVDNAVGTLDNAVGTLDNAVGTPGQKIYSDAELSVAVGNIVSSVADQNVALAVLRLDSLQSKLYLNQHVMLRVAKQQPYTVAG